MEIFLFWAVFSVLVGLFAKVRRDRSMVGWTAFSMVVSPLVGIIVVAILKEKTKTPYRPTDLSPMYPKAGIKRRPTTQNQ